MNECELCVVLFWCYNDVDSLQDFVITSKSAH